MQARHKELTGRSDMKYDDSYYLVWKHSRTSRREYARKDAEYTLALDGLLDKELEADAKIKRLYEDVERPLMEVLYRAEERGSTLTQQRLNDSGVTIKPGDSESRQAVEQTLGFIPEGEGSQDALRDALLEPGSNSLRRRMTAIWRSISKR
jgi:DNA polymerase I-like protein with 3'-5' exonuclease and polymerase domains